ncbi:ras di-ras and rheb family members of small gtpase superfamily [Anaeramoeba ignava]|uniref:Ras di-ras and rheb family members of small gtpase superfamily n=1 Tax=Anaeramoeba ignava TaxID=1746090 RepID=A0A9Q0LS15_ANAIG|nr:ras di-ras and rheb family members of small gtpase superfamily [Anaeramoeba ignava]
MDSEKEKEKEKEKLTIVIFGPGGSGRERIAKRFNLDEFIDEYDPVIEDTFQKTIMIQGEEILIETIVTAGQEDYAAFWPQAARKANCLFLVYSIESTYSFEIIPSRFQYLQESFSSDKEFQEIPKFLIANKIDLENQRKITFQQGEEFAKKNGMHFIEVSAKTAQNIQFLFEKAVFEVLQIRNYLFKFLATFQEEMLQFLERKEFTDFSFIFSNPNEDPIPLHSLLLKYRIGNDYKEKLDKLKNFEKKDVVSFLKCIYSGLDQFYSPKTQELSKSSGIEIKMGRRKLIEDMKKLYSDQESKDFSIIVEEKEIKVHKIILALRSEVYREMFNKVHDDSGKVKDYTNSKFNTFQILIQFFYTDTIQESIALETIQELKQAHDFYQLHPKSSLSPQLEYFETKGKKQTKKDKKCSIF